MSRATGRLGASVVSIVVTCLCFAIGAKPAADDVRATAASIADAVAANDFDVAERRLENSSLPLSIHNRLLASLRFRQQRYADAVPILRKVLVDDENDEVARLYLATALLAIGKPADALSILDSSSANDGTSLNVEMTRSRALAALGSVDDAYATLKALRKRFPAAAEVEVERAILSSTYGNVALAIEAGQRALQLGADVVALGVVAQRLYEDPRALPFLETIHARYPNDVDIAVALAYAYDVAGNPTAAATLFLDAERNASGRGAWYAAEEFLVAGDYRRALEVNVMVSERDRRGQQRARILFAAGHMARVVALTDDLDKADALDAATRYRLAYAHYSLSEMARAGDLASTLKGTAFAGPGASLLEAIGMSGE